MDIVERAREPISELEDPHYLKGLKAEIERLRADNAEWQDRCLRYQTALREIIAYRVDLDDAATRAYAIARRALSNNVDTKPDSV
jgi:preprotein translocase subunit SecA